MRSYFETKGASLSKQVGIDSENGLRISDGREGHLCHGPYISLEAGSYTAAFFIRQRKLMQTGTMSIDVCAEHGAIVLAKRDVDSSDIFHDVSTFVKLDFDTPSDIDQTEVRLFVSAGFIVEIRELLIYRRTSRGWGVQ